MRRTLTLTGAMLVMALIATACPGGDTDDGDDAAGSLLQTVVDRGSLKCGVNNAVPGFGFTDEDGEYAGFDIDFCKAVAAALLDNPDAVEYIPLAADQRFTALQSGEIDVLIRNTTWTAERDGNQRADFVTTTFYDGQGMMVKADSGFDSLEDLDGETICVLSGTTTESNLETVFSARGIDYEPRSLQDTTQIQRAFTQDRCRGWTSDRSQLAGLRSNFPAAQGGPEALTILPEVMSREPLGPVVLEGDSDWYDAINWIVIATIQAEEFGITRENVDELVDSEDPSIQRFLGKGTVTTTPSPDGEPVTNPFDPGLGLPLNFAVRVIAAVGNYEEIYNRNVGTGSNLGLPRGFNRLWTDGGLLYAPPYRA